ncbi:hypothetical protein [Gaiella sp.]|uniref:hypothetical protein n=1 Tax=Gaiella sp. TaxID=2663207 RepID=UPI002E328FE1|nr:hypothetical protein [Gaiella sp.]HEX5585414.1 hypothetical protein [Gaiella sp.]
MATATEPSTAIVSAVIPLAWRTELERRAEENDRSLSSEIRRGLRAYLARTADKSEEPAA